MQEIITYIIISITVIILLFKLIKSFKKSDDCGGCGSSCEECSINKKVTY